MIYVCKPITREYCQIAGNLAFRMNMNEHTAWLVTLASAALAFATLLIATLLLTTSDRDSFNCNGKNPRLLQPSPLQPSAVQPCPLYPWPLATLPVATLRLETLLLAALALAKLPSGADSRQGCAFWHPYHQGEGGGRPGRHRTHTNKGEVGQGALGP